MEHCRKEMESLRSNKVEVSQREPYAASDLVGSLRGMVEAAQSNSMRAAIADLVGEIGTNEMVRILLVEDNEMNFDMLSRRLKRHGFEVIAAPNGALALAEAASESPDLILMDMSLPVMDGWEATRRLKADPATSAIPVIGLTAHAMAEDREKAMDAGCNDYDTKPVDMQRLLGKIRELLPNAQ